MQKNVILLLAICLVFSSCKKGDSKGGTNGNTVTHTPNLITLAYEPGQSIDLLSFHIYDLDHDNNKDKQFFRVKFNSIDSTYIQKGPRSIDSLTAGWPAEVKQVAFGSGAEFIVNGQFFIRIAGGVFNKINYDPASPQHAWYSISRRAGTTATPDGDVVFSSSDYRLFYFSIGKVSTYINSNYSLVDIGSSSGLGQPFSAYAWANVTEAIYFSTQPRFFFFDFKNWTYWTIYRNPSQNNAWIGDPIKSLDHFVKWPDGWGKK